MIFQYFGDRQVNKTDCLTPQCACVHSITSTVWCHDLETICLKGRRKQSADGQVQFNVGGEVVNNSCAKCAAKFWTYLFLAVGGALIALQLQTGSYPYFALLPCKEGTSSLIKSWEHLQFSATSCSSSCSSSCCYELYHVDWKDLRAIFFWPNVLFGKGNDTGWWGSPGRSGCLATLNVSLMRAYLHTQFSLGTRTHKSRTQKLYLNLCWEWSGHGQTSRTGSGAYGLW